MVSEQKNKDTLTLFCKKRGQILHIVDGLLMCKFRQYIWIQGKCHCPQFTTGKLTYPTETMVL